MSFRKSGAAELIPTADRQLMASRSFSGKTVRDPPRAGLAPRLYATHFATSGNARIDSMPPVDLSEPFDAASDTECCLDHAGVAV